MRQEKVTDNIVRNSRRSKGRGSGKDKAGKSRGSRKTKQGRTKRRKRHAHEQPRHHNIRGRERRAGDVCIPVLGQPPMTAFINHRDVIVSNTRSHPPLFIIA